MKRIVLVLAAAIALVALSSDAMACPTCKAALASQDRAQGDMVGGFFWSILFMMAMPFTVLGSFSGLMYWQVRKARHAAAESTGAVEHHVERRAEQSAESVDEPAGV